CLDHPNVQRLLPRLNRRVVTYGFSAQAELRGENLSCKGIETRFDVVWRGTRLGEINLHMPGRHNVSNALAAIAVGLELGVPFEKLADGLDGFTGVDRRFSIRAVIEVEKGRPPITVIDDYGHHPAEITATLAGAREAWPDRRILAVFQPHRFTRVRDLLDDFARAFHDAGHVVVCPVYRAGERPIEGLDATTIGARLVSYGHRSVHIVDALEEATKHLLDEAEPGDVIITLGAGDVNRVCGELAEGLRG
ncbi:MAG: cyanophycin synthetase, partial [Myxococcota bacterium]|nr:cyanophycin synthetase [Myxococcota bacterium]